MGCFSFICQKSFEPVLSDSFYGDAVHLFLLENGKVREHMYGNYDSYGRVFKDYKDFDDRSMTKYSSFEWDMKWGDVIGLMFHEDKSNGIAAILAPYWNEGDPYPTERSEGDPNQGWGKHSRGFGGSDDTVKYPYHKIY